MINLDSIANENNEEHYEKLSYIPDHPYRILIIGGLVVLAQEKQMHCLI